MPPEKQLTKADIFEAIYEIFRIYSLPLRTAKSPHFLARTAVPAGGQAGFGILLSTTKNLGIFFGSGAPTLSAAQGSLYIRTDGSSTSTRMYINTNGSTTWTNVTTAA